jgi:hypothetical protein
MAHIDALSGIFPEGAFCSLDDRSIRQTEAWQALFAKKEWCCVDAGHDGTCRVCGADVGKQDCRCGTCGAVWRKPDDRDVTRSQFSFGVASTIVSCVFGYLSGELAARALRGGVGGGAWRGDFIGLVESYLWVSDAILFLLFCTYLYEKLGMAPKGTWKPQENHEKWKAAQCPDLDRKERNT